MIPKGTILYPTTITSSQMYYYDEPYAYWATDSYSTFCNWVLYKEYNDYISTCAPNDCLAGISYEEVMEELRTFHFYDGMDREKLCKAFRQRSLNATDEEMYNWEDFIYDE